MIALEWDRELGFGLDVYDDYRVTRALKQELYDSAEEFIGREAEGPATSILDAMRIAMHFDPQNCTEWTIRKAHSSAFVRPMSHRKEAKS